MNYNFKEQDLHIKFMKEILLTINAKNYPAYLKGGTALMLCYGQKRFSEDIDLDSNKSFNFENAVKEAAKKLNITLEKINIAKDTKTVKRYKITYNNDMHLKIESSFRNNIDKNDVTVISGIRVYEPMAILNMKFAAVYGKRNRTKARDLHDIVFLAVKYGSLFNQEHKKQLERLANDIDRLMLFEEDYSKTPILQREFEKDIIKLEKAVKMLKL